MDAHACASRHDGLCPLQPLDAARSMTAYLPVRRNTIGLTCLLRMCRGHSLLPRRTARSGGGGRAAARPHRGRTAQGTLGLWALNRCQSVCVPYVARYRHGTNIWFICALCLGCACHSGTEPPAQVRWEAILSLWTNGYEYATILAPAMLTAPRYFAGEIEFGVIAQARSHCQTLLE